MANRTVYYVDKNNNFQEKDVSFVWHRGFSKSQLRKSVSSLHKNFGNVPILETSSVSTSTLGKELSAFNLDVKTTHGTYKVEQLFQAGKIYKKNGSQTELLNLMPKDAKHKIRDINSHDQLVGFGMFGSRFPLIPRTFFYDWIYLHGLSQHYSLAKRLVKYRAFTDIFTNPRYTINSQAKSCAIFVSLYNKYGWNGFQKLMRKNSANKLKEIVY